MSFDFRLRNRCQHKVAYVDATLDLTTLQDLKLPYPVGSEATFVLHANGYDIYPGDIGQFAYILTKDETSPIPDQKKVHFLSSIENLNFSFQASYVVPYSRCPRCRGLEVETDARENLQGGFLTLRKEKKLVQELERFETVKNSSMIFHPNLGTNLQDYIGGKFLLSGFTENRIQIEVQAALEELKRLQRLQQSYQNVDTGEYLDSVQSVRTQRDSIEPTMVIVQVLAKALSGESVELTKILNSSRARAKMPGVSNQ